MPKKQVEFPNSKPKKPMSFKDFLLVDYEPGETGDIIKYNTKKRKGSTGSGSTESYTPTSDNSLEEKKLSVSQRRKLSRNLKRLAPKISRARKRALKRTANTATIKNRAKKQARNELFKKFSKGKSRTSLSPQRRQEIEKRVEKLSNRVEKMTRTLIPKVRKLDRSRKSRSSK